MARFINLPDIDIQLILFEKKMFLLCLSKTCLIKVSNFVKN